MKPLSPSEIETIRVAEPKHDPFSLEALVAWLERQDGASTYNYMDVRSCLACQYLQDRGYCAPWDSSDGGSKLYERALGGGFENEHIAQDRPWTFSAALTRARAALDEQRAGR